MIRKIVIAVFFILGGATVQSQTGDCYRMAALRFLCQHKFDVLRVNESMLGESEPTFILDLITADKNPSGLYCIDSNVFNPDTLFVADLLNRIKKEDYIINEDDIKKSSTLVLEDLCDCVFQALYSSECYDSKDEHACKREYGLSISNVISYKGKKYVVTRIISYFKGNESKMQFCLMEFSNDGILQKCGIGDFWWID